MRSLADAAVGGQPVRIQLQVRRFACARTACARKTFVEQVDDLTVRYGRRSQLLHRLLEAIGLALGGCAGAAGRPVVRAGESDDVATHGPGASRACAGRRHRGGGGRFRVTPRARVRRGHHRHQLPPAARCAARPHRGDGRGLAAEASWRANRVSGPGRRLRRRRPTGAPDACRSLTDGTCGTTSPRRWRRPSSRTAAELRPIPGHTDEAAVEQAAVPVADTHPPRRASGGTHPRAVCGCTAAT